ncbi:MAG TPA: efflux RND transporter periplasmic adaptor subunit [Burkholderiales bacterium]|nr:efflux RND transporter periplasmic adaptor subunit [Burkholderiales bacterium]
MIRIIEHGMPNRSGIRIAAVLGVLAALTACGKEEAKPPEARLVNVVRVQPASGNGEVAYSGDVRARYETNLSFRVAGKIVARNVEVGTVVKAGEILARLDPEDQKLNAQGAQSQLAAAQSEYDQLKAELERYADLYKKEFISKADYDRRLSLFNVAQARLDQAKAQLSVTQNQTGYTALGADHAGVVTAIQAEVGQVVAAGQIVMKLARTDDKEVMISIPENRLAELGGSREIAITLWASPASRYRGKVREISPSADPVTRTYAAKISVLNPDAAMKLGMTANVYLRGVQRGASAMLPATALFQQGGKAAVWVVDAAASTVKLVPVEVGEYVEDKVAITGGLKQGDVVVKAGVHKLFDGEKVRIAEEPGSASDPAREPAREAAK